MAKCIFCGHDRPDFTGVFLLKNDGTTVFYCSSKCRKNHLKLERDKRNMKWTEAYRISLAKRLETEKKAKEAKPNDSGEKKSKKSSK